MILLSRMVPYIGGLLIGLTFEIWSLRPDWIVASVAIVVFITVVSVWLLTGRAFRNFGFWNFVSTPLLFIIGACTFLLLVDNFVVRQLFIVSIMVLYILISQNIFSFNYRSKRYQPYALENIYSYINMVTLFLIYASCYGAALLLGISFWAFLPVIFILTGFLFTRTLWSYKIIWKDSKRFIFIVSVLLTEVAIAVYYLPTSFVVNAFILLVVYYLAANIFKDQLRDNFNPKAVRIYLLISLSALIATFLTTRWD